MTNSAQYDVLVIGGGAAGLSAALTLGRMRRSALVVDAGEPRNAPAAHMQAFLSRDGLPPRELLEIGRREVKSYGVEIADDRVTEIAQVPGGFEARTASGRQVRARRVVLALGLRDVLPGILGLQARFGKDVVHCPYCHGWEVRDQRIGVLATGPMAAHQAQLFRQLSGDVTVLVNDIDIPADEKAGLLARGIVLRTGRVVEVTVADDRLTGVRLEGGEHVPFDALAVATRMEVPTDLAHQLGVDLTELPGIGRHVTVDEVGRSSVEGVWAVGNTADLKLQVINAAASGNLSGAMINMDLIQEEIAEALVQRADR
ncbi:NAD(P)/FAD-dependent oxidoreductase [Luteipulveratus mongoliensis]|uniref:FAD/NAD(P)-binding domain-containing protein n=1 Tax=Luteipulveratus mongoliensis TaxID=571913 RepID=A0A0K1JIW8_9MICO|nr:NAD(P)/FAD-dependent oxidoreductase [Luteipulveratus mongoliensis]AKU16651.1 hypothetical protein VV02_13540 [Luteipulveratus mongoliensis]